MAKKAPAPNPEANLGYLIHDVARLLRRNFNRRAQTLGLTQAQCRAILHLYRCEGIQQVALAELLEVQPITLARLLDKLEAAGLVERRRDPSDRRAFCLYLTPKAHPLLEQIWQLGAETRRDAYGTLDDAAVQRFLHTLQTLKTHLLNADVEPIEPPHEHPDE